MVDPRLVNYIKSQLSKGSLEQIRQILISRGWPDYQIKPAIELATQQVDSAVRGFEHQINFNPTQTSQSYQEPVKEKSSKLWILLASGIVLIAGGVLTLIVLIIK